jgi:tetratricopeptide (TPR) repeat protein
VEKSIDLICKGELKGGVRELERAAALAPDNAPLNSFLGEHFFREGKQALARDYLQRAFDAGVAKDSRVPLLLGIACADEADTEQAKTLLDDWIKQRGSSFAAHYALGKLFAGKELWREALAEFKQALVMRPSPEAHYLIGAVYYLLKHNRMAERHLRKALALDAAYAAAHYLLGLVLLRANDRRAARQAFGAASAADPETTLYRTARESLSKTKQTNLLLPLINLFGIAAAPSKGKGLVTGADLRLALLVREDALQAQQRQIEPK